MPMFNFSWKKLVTNDRSTDIYVLYYVSKRFPITTFTKHIGSLIFQIKYMIVLMGCLILGWFSIFSNQSFPCKKILPSRKYKFLQIFILPSWRDNSQEDDSKEDYPGPPGPRHQLLVHGHSDQGELTEVSTTRSWFGQENLPSKLVITSWGHLQQTKLGYVLGLSEIKINLFIFIFHIYFVIYFFNNVCLFCNIWYIYLL